MEHRKTSSKGEKSLARTSTTKTKDIVELVWEALQDVTLIIPSWQHSFHWSSRSNTTPCIQEQFNAAQWQSVW
ncbi:hypothetical protein FQN60_014512 [Etheostoma spectabile]|uniref:Uncharacterized protein n=1 Tax=Etheostoma spectabile TaxID=54343 RepID=A0A5J5D793_9PERO|nr:hypothetical protein FQN60_014512 [Etheostoma spectabile]